MISRSIGLVECRERSAAVLPLASFHGRPMSAVSADLVKPTASRISHYLEIAVGKNGIEILACRERVGLFLASSRLAAEPYFDIRRGDQARLSSSSSCSSTLAGAQSCLRSQEPLLKPRRDLLLLLRSCSFAVRSSSDSGIRGRESAGRCSRRSVRMSRCSAVHRVRGSTRSRPAALVGNHFSLVADAVHVDLACSRALLAGSGPNTLPVQR